MKKSKKLLALILALLMLVGIFAGCAKKPAAPADTGGKTETPSAASSGKTEPKPDSSAVSSTEVTTTVASSPAGTSGDAKIPEAETFKLTFAESYDDVKKALEDYWNETGAFRGEFGTATTGMAVTEAAVAADDVAMAGGSASVDVPMEVPAPDVNMKAEEAEAVSVSSAKGGGDYSETNVQVKGVDEGDIVKTDGEFIYVLKDKELAIVKADGEQTEKVSVTQILPEDNWNDNGGSSVYANEMYVFGDRIAVVGEKYEWSNDKYYKSTDYTDIFLFDISDRSNPTLIGEVGQDGYCTTTRLVGNKLYIVSGYYIWNVDENEPETYIPRLYTNGTAKTVEACDICILPNINSESYVIVSAIDVENGETIASQSVLGQSGTVYMNADNLFVCSSRFDTQESEPYTADQYKVVDYSEICTTDIIRFDIADGGVKAAASGSVPGNLLNQFSLDEKDGYLRVVTTIDNYSYSVYTDEKYGFSNYQWGDSYSANSLFILDENLESVGSIENLAEDERVYSVRFDGDIGYFVTFRQVDPLFAVDLSDPAKPELLSSLKIPGFSDYLHVYSDGRLFGLGREADEETGWIECMKLSMFDVSDPTDVTECAYLSIDDSSWSVALYNHKAILICEEKDLIAFPLENEYVVYGYSDEEGFYERARFDIDLDAYDARGLYIGDYIYICTRYAINVFDMDTFNLVSAIEF